MTSIPGRLLKILFQAPQKDLKAGARFSRESKIAIFYPPCSILDN
jgi:hypothetical protein